MIVEMVIAMPKCFPPGEVTLDITVGKLFFLLSYGRDRVPTRRLSMRKTKKVLRLRFRAGAGAAGHSPRLLISQSTVHEYLDRAAAAGLVWPLGEEWTSSALSRPCSESDRW